MTPDTELVRTAYHEASHGVATTVLFRRHPPPLPAVKFIEITEYEPGQWSGHCVNRGIGSVQWPSPSTMREAQVLIHMAGWIGEAISRGVRDGDAVLRFAARYGFAASTGVDG